MGFEPKIRKIVDEIAHGIQSLMYTTTTWPHEIKTIVGDLLINIVQANIGNEDELAANRFITQDFSAWLEHGIAKA